MRADQRMLTATARLQNQKRITRCTMLVALDYEERAGPGQALL